MSCGLISEWYDKLIISPVTPMEILALQWKVSTLRWKASNDSDGKTKALRWEITPHTTTTATFANTKIISIKWCLVGRCIVEVNGNTILTRDASIRSVCIYKTTLI